MRTYLLMAAVLLAGCRESAQTVKIGLAGPYKENYGLMTKLGAQLALDEINARPDQRIKLDTVVRDDEADGVKAAAIAAEFVADRAIVGVVGHVTSGAMKAAAKVYDGNLAALATAASAPELSGISPWAFRLIASDSANGASLAKLATAAGHKRVAILYENNPYGRGLAEAFRRHYAGGAVVSMDPIGEGDDQDFEPFAAYFQRQQPDLVFVASTEIPGIPLVAALRRAGVGAQLMGGDGWTGMTNDSSGHSEGTIVGAPFTAEDERQAARQFTQRFRARFKRDPDGNAALGYDATHLLAAAVRAVGPDREKIRDWLAKLDAKSAHEGASGPIHFTTGGDPVATGVVMTRVEKGTLVVLEGAR